MLVVLILISSVSLSVSDVTFNELVSAFEQHPAVPQNLALPFQNYDIDNKGTLSNPTPIQQVAFQPQNAVNCPNKTILLNLVNILIDALHQDGKTVLDSAKFKYLLTVVKNFLEITPLNPENLEFYKFPPSDNQNCKEMFNNLMNFMKTAYAQVLKYCLTTEKCYINNNLNNIPSSHNRINPFYPYAPIQRNSTTNIWPSLEHLPKESMIAGADLVNFMNSQKDQTNDIMSMLANYKPTGTMQENIYNTPAQEKKPNGLQNPPYVTPGNNQVPSLYPNEIYGKNPNLQPSNIKVPPNMNTVPWHNILPGLHGSSGDKHKQFTQLFKKFYEEHNNVSFTSSSQPGVVPPLGPLNVQIPPFNNRIPSADDKVFTGTNPTMNIYPNQVIDILKRLPNPNQNSPQAENKNLVDSTRLANVLQYLQHLQNLNMQQRVLQNILPQRPQQSLPNHVAYNQNQNILNHYFANQLLPGFNHQFQNGVGFNQILPYLSAYNTKYNHGQNMFIDNTKQGNHGGALFDLNHLLSVANAAKLNAIPNKNGIVELTYMLKRPKPVDETQYYVKYRMPYQTFLYNLQKLLNKKPNLRSEPNKLYEVLLLGSNVTDTPDDLKGLDYEDILKLTSTNGTLVTAKILDNYDTTADQTLKLVQKLNSQLPVENIINVNTNATKNIQLENQNNVVNGSNNKNSDINDLLKNVYPTFLDVRRGLYPNLKYPFSNIGQYPPRLQYNPYSVYQAKPTLGNVGVPFLKNNIVPFLPYTNILKNPTLYSPYLVRNPQFGR